MPSRPKKNIDDFVMKHQILMNWCWAAVSVSVAEHSTGNPLRECDIAAKCLDLDCCGQRKPCDQEFFLDLALKTVGQLKRVETSRLTFDAIKSEIDAGRPVCVRVEWAKEKTGHFVAITGYDTTPTGRQIVLTDDPFYGKARTEYSTFLTRYQGEGAWTHTYFLKGRA